MLADDLDGVAAREHKRLPAGRIDISSEDLALTMAPVDVADEQLIGLQHNLDRVTDGGSWRLTDAQRGLGRASRKTARGATGRDCSSMRAMSTAGSG